MEANDNILKLLDDYLAGRLPADEKAELEQKLSSDPSFTAEAKQLMSAILGAELSGREQLKASLLARQADLKSRQSTSVRHPVWRYIATTAAILLILAAITFSLRNINRSSSPDQLYTTYFEAPDIPAYRDSNAKAGALWQSASSDYTSGEFDIAAEKLKQLIESGNSNDLSRDAFFLGISLLESGDPAGASSNFAKVSKESLYAPDSKWFRALAYLKSEDLDSASRLLDEIANAEFHHKKADAKKLLKRLQ